MDKDVADRTAIVTGGGTGIGYATAVALSGLTISSQTCDVGSPDDITALVDATVQRFDGIDILVNNAAYIEMAAIEDASVAAFDQTFAVNVRGPMLLAQAALPHLRESDHASIVNISSVAVEMGGATMGLHRSSKMALLGPASSAESSDDG